FVHEDTVALPPPEAFERLRHFARIYPQLHPAHQPHPPGQAPELLRAGSRFSLFERFGLEQRRYRFEVEAYEPENGYMRLFARTRTSWGPAVVRSTLLIEFSLFPDPGGTRLVVSQRVSLGPAWLDAALDRPWLWRSVAAHAEAECRAAVALLGEPAEDLTMP
ncbi:MAG: hypothetical protein ACLGIN_05820, partial [Candidatus Sericytochromatia bacterium]